MRYYSLLSLLFTSIFVIGCAHSQSPSTLNRLQIKVAQLERKLDNRDKAINDLQQKVQSLTGQVDDIDTYALNEPVEEYDYRKSANNIEIDDDYEEKYVAKAKNKKEEIIRVSASPRDVQRALKNAGYYSGKIDGKIGSQSKNAIGKFQTDHSLKSDGIIGKRTWSELKSYLD